MSQTRKRGSIAKAKYFPEGCIKGCQLVSFNPGIEGHEEQSVTRVYLCETFHVSSGYKRVTI